MQPQKSQGSRAFLNTGVSPNKPWPPLRWGFLAQKSAWCVVLCVPRCHILEDRNPTEQDRNVLWTATDWRHIAELYDRLRADMPSPVVDLNRTVAHSMALGPVAGLRLVDEIAENAALRNYAPLSAARDYFFFRAALTRIKGRVRGGDSTHD